MVRACWVVVFCIIGMVGGLCDLYDDDGDNDVICIMGMLIAVVYSGDDDYSDNEEDCENGVGDRDYDYREDDRYD